MERDTGYLPSAMESNSGAVPLMLLPWTLSAFESRNEKPKMPNAFGLATSF